MLDWAYRAGTLIHRSLARIALVMEYRVRLAWQFGKEEPRCEIRRQSNSWYTAAIACTSGLRSMTKVQQMLSTGIRVRLLLILSHNDTCAVSASPSCQTHNRLSAYLLAAVLLPDCPVQLASLVLALQLDRPLMPFTSVVSFFVDCSTQQSAYNSVVMVFSFVVW